MQNHLQNHPKGQICPVLTVGWPMLSGFVVEGWKSDFCDSSRVKIGFFPFSFPIPSSFMQSNYLFMIPLFSWKKLSQITVQPWPHLLWFCPPDNHLFLNGCYKTCLLSSSSAIHLCYIHTHYYLLSFSYKRLEVLAAFTNAVSFQLSILLIHVHAIVALKFRFLISTIFC